MVFYRKFIVDYKMYFNLWVILWIIIIKGFDEFEWWI